MDPGNTIIFHALDDGLSCGTNCTITDRVTISGASFYNSNYLTFASNPNNTESYEAYFNANVTTGPSAWWQSVTFEACASSPTGPSAGSYTVNCSTGKNSFEFDNLEWQVTACNNCMSPIPGLSPTAVPEPIEFPASVGVFVALCGWVKRQTRIAQF